MAFVKLDTDTLDSSLWSEPPETRLVFLTMLMMSNAEGVVRSTAPGISNRARIELSKTRDALATLEAPDPDDKSGVDEGRRIRRVPGGYSIINYLAYRNKDHAAAVRVRNWRERAKTGIDELIHKQDGKCDCCQEPFQVPYAKYVVQDHCHASEGNRGLVCQSCNRVIGQVENNTPVRNEKKIPLAEAYLARWRNVSGNGCNVTVTQAYAEAEAYTEKKEGGVPPHHAERFSVTGRIGKVSVPIPPGLGTPEFTAAYASWVEYRKQKKSKLTPITVERQFAKLAKMGPARAIAALNHSIEQGWTGIFEPDEKRGDPRKKNDRAPSHLEPKWRELWDKIPDDVRRRGLATVEKHSTNPGVKASAQDALVNHAEPRQSIVEMIVNAHREGRLK